MKRASFALLLLVLVVASLAHGGEEKKQPPSKLEGTWIKEKDNEKIVATFAKEKFMVALPDGRTVKGTFKSDAAKKPAELDIAITEGDAKVEGKTVLAIYEISGNTLKICANDPAIGNPRPKTFPEQEGGSDGNMFLIFKKGK